MDFFWECVKSLKNENGKCKKHQYPTSFSMISCQLLSLSFWLANTLSTGSVKWRLFCEVHPSSIAAHLLIRHKYDFSYHGTTINWWSILTTIYMGREFLRSFLFISTGTNLQSRDGRNWLRAKSIQVMETDVKSKPISELLSQITKIPKPPVVKSSMIAGQVRFTIQKFSHHSLYPAVCLM